MESLEKTITARNLLFAELVANSDKISEISDSLDDFRDGIDKIIETNQQRLI